MLFQNLNSSSSNVQTNNINSSNGGGGISITTLNQSTGLTGSSSGINTSMGVSIKANRFHLSISYLATALLIVLFTSSLIQIGITFEQNTVLAQFFLSIFIWTLHLLFSLYIYPMGTKYQKLIRSINGLAIGSVICYLICILYGAPLFKGISRTFFFGFLLSSMVTVPTSVLLGCNPHAWKDLFFTPTHNSIYDTCCTIIVVFSIIGSWIGAFPIPLDWDRPWQKWPISCIYGSLGGHILGLLVCSIYSLFYKEKKSN